MPAHPPSKRNAHQVAAYEFLLGHARSRQPFTSAELAAAARWEKSSATTYIGKHLRDYLEEITDGYRVRIDFTRLTLDQFLRHTTQNRPVYTEYDRVKYERLVDYEFLLPLTREDRLRRALDDLFYGDTTAERLTDIGLENFEAIVPREDTTSDEEYIQHICEMVSQHFVGYSIGHVNGRYRLGDLMSREEAGNFLAQGGRYLIDETTAVVRFLIKCNASKSYFNNDVKSILQAINEDVMTGNESDVVAEIGLIRALFFHLFVESVVRTVQGEEEIWLLERSNSQTLRLGTHEVAVI